MMNKTLQKELNAHFNKINNRKKELDIIEKSLMLRDESTKQFEEEIEVEVTKKIKEALDKNNFDYEKGRNRKGTRIIFQNGFVKIREYKTHGFGNVSVLTSEQFNEFLPSGLIEARVIICEKLKEINEIILEFKDKTKFKKGIDIQVIKSDGIEKLKAKEIEISFNCEEEHSSYNRGRYHYGNTDTYKSRSERFEVKLNGWTHNVDEALYSDEVFNAVISLIDKFKTRIKEVEQIRQNKRSELRDFVFNQMNKMIILGELKDE